MYVRIHSSSNEIAVDVDIYNERESDDDGQHSKSPEDDAIGSFKRGSDFEIPNGDSFRRDNGQAPKSCVYLLKAGPFYKIGRAKDFQCRVRNIKLQLPYKVEELHVILTHDEIRLEYFWHCKFKHLRQNGEWFLLTDDDVSEFCKYTLM